MPSSSALDKFSDFIRQNDYTEASTLINSLDVDERAKVFAGLSLEVARNLCKLPSLYTNLFIYIIESSFRADSERPHRVRYYEQERDDDFKNSLVGAELVVYEITRNIALSYEDRAKELYTLANAMLQRTQEMIADLQSPSLNPPVQQLDQQQQQARKQHHLKSSNHKRKKRKHSSADYVNLIHDSSSSAQKSAVVFVPVQSLQLIVTVFKAVCKVAHSSMLEKRKRAENKNRIKFMDSDDAHQLALELLGRILKLPWDFPASTMVITAINEVSNMTSSKEQLDPKAIIGPSYDIDYTESYEKHFRKTISQKIQILLESPLLVVSHYQSTKSRYYNHSADYDTLTKGHTLGLLKALFDMITYINQENVNIHHVHRTLRHHYMSLFRSLFFKVTRDELSNALIVIEIAMKNSPQATETLVTWYQMLLESAKCTNPKSCEDANHCHELQDQKAQVFHARDLVILCLAAKSKEYLNPKDAWSVTKDFVLLPLHCFSSSLMMQDDPQFASSSSFNAKESCLLEVVNVPGMEQRPLLLEEIADFWIHSAFEQSSRLQLFSLSNKIALKENDIAFSTYYELAYSGIVILRNLFSLYSSVREPLLASILTVISESSFDYNLRIAKCALLENIVKTDREMLLPYLNLVHDSLSYIHIIPLTLVKKILSQVIYPMTAYSRAFHEKMFIFYRKLVSSRSNLQKKYGLLGFFSLIPINLGDPVKVIDPSLKVFASASTQVQIDVLRHIATVFDSLDYDICQSNLEGLVVWYAQFCDIFQNFCIKSGKSSKPSYVVDIDLLFSNGTKKLPYATDNYSIEIAPYLLNVIMTIEALLISVNHSFNPIFDTVKSFFSTPHNFMKLYVKEKGKVASNTLSSNLLSIFYEVILSVLDTADHQMYEILVFYSMIVKKSTTLMLKIAPSIQARKPDMRARITAREAKYEQLESLVGYSEDENDVFRCLGVAEALYLLNYILQEEPSIYDKSPYFFPTFSVVKFVQILLDNVVTIFTDPLQMAFEANREAVCHEIFKTALLVWDRSCSWKHRNWPKELQRKTTRKTPVDGSVNNVYMKIYERLLSITSDEVFLSQISEFEGHTFLDITDMTTVILLRTSVLRIITLLLKINTDLFESESWLCLQVEVDDVEEIRSFIISLNRDLPHEITSTVTIEENKLPPTRSDERKKGRKARQISGKDTQKESKIDSLREKEYIILVKSIQKMGEFKRDPKNFRSDIALQVCMMFIHEFQFGQSVEFTAAYINLIRMLIAHSPCADVMRCIFSYVILYVLHEFESHANVCMDMLLMYYVEHNSMAKPYVFAVHVIQECCEILYERNAQDMSPERKRLVQEDSNQEESQRDNIPPAIERTTRSSKKKNRFSKQVEQEEFQRDDAPSTIDGRTRSSKKKNGFEIPVEREEFHRENLPSTIDRITRTGKKKNGFRKSMDQKEFVDNDVPPTTNKKTSSKKNHGFRKAVEPSVEEEKETKKNVGYSSRIRRLLRTSLKSQPKTALRVMMKYVLSQIPSGNTKLELNLLSIEELDEMLNGMLELMTKGKMIDEWVVVGICDCVNRILRFYNRTIRRIALCVDKIHTVEDGLLNGILSEDEIVDKSMVINEMIGKVLRALSIMTRHLDFKVAEKYLQQNRKGHLLSRMRYTFDLLFVNLKRLLGKIDRRKFRSILINHPSNLKIKLGLNKLVEDWWQEDVDGGENDTFGKSADVIKNKRKPMMSRQMAANEDDDDQNNDYDESSDESHLYFTNSKMLNGRKIRRKRLRSSVNFIDRCLMDGQGSGADDYADLEDFVVDDIEYD